MKLSVIIPALKRDERAERTIESVRRATKDIIETEIIVVEGLSPVGKARNEGLRRAKGEYIAWVDADDEVSEEWIGEIFAVISTSHPDVITFDAELVGWSNSPDLVWGVKAKDVTISRLCRDLCRDMSRSGSVWLYVTRRDLWEELWFDESAEIAEDYMLMPWVLFRAKSCVYIPKKLYRYIHRSTSLINTCDAQKRVRVHKKMYESDRTLPPAYRRKRLWGMALWCFWDRNNREFVRRHLLVLIAETLFGPDLTFTDRIKTTLRFVWFGLGGGGKR